MKFADYEVAVSSGSEQSSGHVLMQHGAEYALILKSFNMKRSDAEVSVDGKFIGTWRLDGLEVVRIERPADVEKKLTFFRLDSPEGDDANLQAISKDVLGLVSVKFTPEKQISKPHDRVVRHSGASSGLLRATVSDVVSAGGTGLGVRSEQRFSTAPHIERDEEAVVTINLRLVEGPVVSELKPAVAPVPKSTPIPQPVWLEKRDPAP